MSKYSYNQLNTVFSKWSFHIIYYLNFNFKYWSEEQTDAKWYVEYLQTDGEGGSRHPFGVGIKRQCH